MNENSTRSLGIQIAALVVAIAVCFVPGAIGGLATASSVNDWFVDLNKPSWNPPNWIFGPVWSTLYLMMGIALWLVWKASAFEKAKLAIGWFLFHLVLNVMWSVIFFGMQQPGWAFGEILILWISIVVAIVLFYRHSKLAAALLVPYLLWVTFATALNYAIWSLNRA